MAARISARWPATVSWLHEHTEAAAGFALNGGPVDAAAAAAAGFDLLVAPADAELDAWPAERPLLATVAVPADPDSALADELLERLRRLAAERLLAARVSPGKGGLAEQLMLCDRIHQELGLPTVLVGPPSHDEAATAIVAGRAELVEGLPSLLGGEWRKG